jgi:hypothetical protein
MPAASFASVRSSLERGKLVPVYYLTGDEEVLKDELVDAIVDSAVDPSNRDFNLDVRSAADLDGESFHALVETPPLLAERRAAVVRNLEQWRKNSATVDIDGSGSRSRRWPGPRQDADCERPPRFRSGSRARSGT